MKTAEQIANEIYDREESWAWALGRERLVPMMVAAIRADRAQRRSVITLKDHAWRVRAETPIEVYDVVADLLEDYPAESIVWEGE